MCSFLSFVGSVMLRTLIVILSLVASMGAYARMAAM
jgi:hypothetical protein